MRGLRDVEPEDEEVAVGSARPGEPSEQSVDNLARGMQALPLRKPWEVCPRAAPG